MKGKKRGAFIISTSKPATFVYAYKPSWSCRSATISTRKKLKACFNKPVKPYFAFGLCTLGLTGISSPKKSLPDLPPVENVETDDLATERPTSKNSIYYHAFSSCTWCAVHIINLCVDSEWVIWMKRVVNTALLKFLTLTFSSVKYNTTL